MRSYPVKENPIGSAVSEILCYKQTGRQTSFFLLLCIIEETKIVFGSYKIKHSYLANKIVV